ncbi:MAG: hypothetical protein RL111_250 [Pseudomonadota bacterium]
MQFLLSLLFLLMPVVSVAQTTDRITNSPKMECQDDTDCLKGFSCRSTPFGGTRCRRIVDVDGNSSTPSLQPLIKATDMECEVDSDCQSGYSCRSKPYGGTRCVRRMGSDANSSLLEEASQKLLLEQEQRRKREALELEQKAVESQIVQPNSPVMGRAERRTALVIGNAKYAVNPLPNPVNDANDMARALRSVGFEVIEINNATLAQMRDATRRFADRLASSDVGLVYYSGHGVEVKGRNYLIPVNADIKREYEVSDQAFDASQFTEMMDAIRGPNNKRVNILLVDACRNNDLQRSWRSVGYGLARMDAPGGTFISFATAPGKVASDGAGRNSPYTKHLLQVMRQPNLPIEQVFKLVRRNVMEETKGEQIPWDNSSLVGDFVFKRTAK